MTFNIKAPLLRADFIMLHFEFEEEYLDSS